MFELSPKPVSLPELHQASGRLENLTTAEIESICQTHPRWMFEYRPHFVACYNPGWLVYANPRWCMKHCTSEMLLRRKDWVAQNEPEIMFQTDPGFLMEQNPMWVINNHPEYVSVFFPDVLGKYTHDTLYRYRPDLDPNLKDSVWWPRIKRVFRALWPFWVQRYDALKNPKLPKEIIDAL